MNIKSYLSLLIYYSVYVNSSPPPKKKKEKLLHILVICVFSMEVKWSRSRSSATLKLRIVIEKVRNNLKTWGLEIETWRYFSPYRFDKRRLTKIYVSILWNELWVIWLNEFVRRSSFINLCVLRKFICSCGRSWFGLFGLLKHTSTENEILWKIDIIKRVVNFLFRFLFLYSSRISLYFL